MFTLDRLHKDLWLVATVTFIVSFIVSCSILLLLPAVGVAVATVEDYYNLRWPEVKTERDAPHLVVYVIFLWYKLTREQKRLWFCELLN